MYTSGYHFLLLWRDSDLVYLTQGTKRIQKSAVDLENDLVFDYARDGPRQTILTALVYVVGRVELFENIVVPKRGNRVDEWLQSDENP